MQPFRRLHALSGTATVEGIRVSDVPAAPDEMLIPSDVTLSVVIPAYNEEQRLGRTLTETLAYFHLQSYRHEIVVVDDGSKDRTVAIAEEFGQLSKGAVRVVRNPGNRGKGFAVRNGVLAATGDVVLFFDADLSTPLTEVPKVVGPIVRGESDVVIGSRRTAQRATQTALRRFIGGQFRRLRRALLGLSFHDTQCGFKAFGRDAALAVFSQQKISGFAFDVEVLLLAQEQGWRTLDRPVEWVHQEGSKVRPFVSSMQMLMELVKIRRQVQRRRHIRQETHAMVRVVATDWRAEDCQLADISAGGAFVRMEKPFPVGTEVTTFVPLPSGDMLPLLGQVVRTGYAPGQEGIGIAFLNASPEDVVKLESFIARL